MKNSSEFSWYVDTWYVMILKILIIYLYTCLLISHCIHVQDKPWVYAHLLALQKKLGKENFPLMEQSFFQNHKDIVGSKYDVNMFQKYILTGLGRRISLCLQNRSCSWRSRKSESWKWGCFRGMHFLPTFEANFKSRVGLV